MLGVCIFRNWRERREGRGEGKIYGILVENEAIQISNHSIYKYMNDTSSWNLNVSKNVSFRVSQGNYDNTIFKKKVVKNSEPLSLGNEPFGGDNTINMVMWGDSGSQGNMMNGKGLVSSYKVPMRTEVKVSEYNWGEFSRRYRRGQKWTGMENGESEKELATVFIVELVGEEMFWRWCAVDSMKL